MAGLTISDKILDKYFAYLKDLDSSAKKRLISKLTGSLESKPNNDSDWKSLFGAWVDSRTSDEIIDDIKASRVEKSNMESFE